MAFKHGKGTKFLFDEFDISSYLTSSVVNAEIDNPVTTTYGNNGVRRQVVGLKDGSVTAEFLHDAASSSASHAVLTGTYGSTGASILTRAPEGLTIGLPVELLQVREKTYAPGSPVDGVVGGTVTFEGDGGVDFGKSLHDLTAETATGDSASVNNGAASTNGGVAHIHCTSVSASDTLDAKVQHSTNDTVWVDLVTFTQLAAAGKQRVEVAAGTTVNQYLRETHTLAGAGISITYAVAFARR